MEIKFTNTCFPFRKRFLMIIMKTFIFLCCTIVFSLAPNNIVSQNTKIKVNEDTTLTVDEVFKLIMNQTDYRFIYEKGIFTDFPKVQIKKGTVKVNKLLKRSLSQENLEIIVTDNNAILIKEKPTDINLEKLQQIEISGTVVDQNGQPLPRCKYIRKRYCQWHPDRFRRKFFIECSRREYHFGSFLYRFCYTGGFYERTKPNYNNIARRCCWSG